MTTTTGTSATQTATKSLLTSLGSGSGVDTASLVTSLVEAQFAARTAQLTAKAEKLTAQISGVSTIRSAIAGFATALDTLAKGGTLATQPRSSAPSVLAATATASGTPATLAATVRVERLASGQAAATARIAGPSGPATRASVLGSGTFTLQLGTADYDTADGITTMADFEAVGGSGNAVSFEVRDASVDTIAAAINDKGRALGISASVVTGANGEAFLSLTGATGGARAFTLSVEGDAALDQFAIGEGSTVTGRAQNAALTVDGVPVERATNTIDDLVTGVRLDLAGTGTTTLSATRPTAALTQAVDDLVETYNGVVAVIEEQTNAKTGKLFGDPAAQSLLKKLKGMTLATLGSGTPSTLAELGVRTARDGTLSVDKAQVAKALTAAPDAVEAMFRPSTTSATGLPALIQSLATAATSTATGLGASTARFTAAQAEVTTAQGRIATDSTALTTRLTSQFAGMNARVSAYKSVQGFLTNQIAAWNKSDG